MCENVNKSMINMKDLKKIKASILGGIIYWITIKLILWVNDFFKINDFFLGICITLIIPGGMSFFLIFLLKEKRHKSMLLYVLMFIVIYYFIEFTHILLSLGLVLSFQIVTSSLKRVGIYILCSAYLSGLIGVYINRILKS